MRFKPSVYLAVAIFFSSATANASTTLFSDNFDADTLGTNASLLNWSVVNGSIDVIGDPNFFDFYPGNGRYLDLDGSSSNAGRIESIASFNFDAAATYRLSFDYGRNQQITSTAETLTYGAGDFSGQIDIPAGSIPTLIGVSFEFSSSAEFSKLFFQAAGGDNTGPVLDNVVLEQLSEVPLPTTLPMLITAITGFALFRSRRNRPA